MPTLLRTLTSLFALLLIAGCAEAEKMARTVVESSPTATASANSSSTMAQRAGAVAQTAAASTDTLRYAGWNTDAASYYIEETGERWYATDGGTFTYRCEGTNLRGDLSNDTFGDNPYRVASRVCIAGVHAGVIAAAEGGDVTIEIVQDGPTTYPAVERNGVTTRSYNAEGESMNIAFRVLGAASDD